MEQYLKDLSNFYVAGINYKKSDAAVRGQFAIGTPQYKQILERCRQQGLDEVFILSTCNRTEIYGFAYCAHQLIDVLCTQTAGDAATFTQAAYIKNGNEVVEHLFHVAAGLDSQILGDYEIVGQLKTAVKFAKQHGFIGCFTERLINSVLQASKLIKTNTQLSGGTVSVSFAAVQYIRQHIKEPHLKNILLIGTGKIGSNTCLNLVDYIGANNITIINRSPEKAQTLAAKLGLSWAAIEYLSEEIKKADVVITATSATEPLILPQHFSGHGNKLIIDLSIPYNVHPSVGDLENIRLIHVDELSKMKDETLKMRKAEVPKAKAIIAELMAEFEAWCEMRKHVPMLRQLKTKLKELYGHPHYTNTATAAPKNIDSQIQKLLNETAGKIKLQNQRGCHYIAALHQFISAKN